MVTTQQVRDAWAPACATHEQSLRSAYESLDGVLDKWNYKLRQADTGAFNCRKITGGTGYSLHAYNPNGRFTFWNGVSVTMAIAVDLNWQTNPYGPNLVTDMPREMVDEILAIRTVNGKQVWRWGGDYRNNKDAMHYEVICTPTDLALGIQTETEPTPEPNIPTTLTEENNMPGTSAVARGDDSIDVFYVREGRLRQKYWRSGKWEGPVDLGKPPKVTLDDNAPGVSVRHGGKSIDVFALGSDGNLWQRYWRGGPKWSAWTNKGQA